MKLLARSFRRAGSVSLVWGCGHKTVDEEAGDTSGLEEEEDSFVDIDGTLGTRCDQKCGIRGTGMMGKWVEVVTRSRRRAGRVVYGK